MVFGVSLSAVLTLSGLAGPAGAAVVGFWQMNEPAGSTQMLDSSTTVHHSEVFRGVSLTGNKYLFPGWSANLDAGGSLTGVLADPESGEIRVLDPTNQLMPGLDSFGIQLRLKPLLRNGLLPFPGTGSNSTPSYNILQRGRANDIGGTYKLELMGYGPRSGRVHCTMRAPGFPALDVYSAPIVDGLAHKIDCSLDRTLSQLRITTDGVLSDVKTFNSYGSIEPRDIYGFYLTIGKKPGSNVPADAYAGQIDWVTISRGEPVGR